MRSLRKYLKDTKVVKSATSPAEIKKFNDLVAIFRKYADKYEIDYLLMMAQGYQESRLDQQAKSPVGAIGVMQLMPATGQDMKVGDIKADRPQHRGRREVHALHDRPVLQGRADGPR